MFIPFINWCMLYDTDIIFDRSEFKEMDVAVEDIVVEELLKRMLKKYKLLTIFLAIYFTRACSA
ncbi:hypothetical protein [Carnobacterium maltaromaticum]|uniref:hypothetical protein n=1 Tax=Carnobacterium maltaromaticum TaxID=2751 RepID=UPI00191BBC6B|nr:hypothetical protein [Carnobacterium maltaromaticum]CAD5896401.1 hypothetical protein CMALT394_100004 [Carnobacterium maltaromaticum]